MRISVLVNSLCRALEPLENRSDLHGALKLIQQWLTVHAKYFSGANPHRWWLESFAQFDLSALPVERARVELDDQLARWRRLSAGSTDVFSIALSSFLWSVLTVETDLGCPVCRGGGLRVLEDEAQREVLLECTDCTWVQHQDGRRWTGKGLLKPASRAALERYERG